MSASLTQDQRDDDTPTAPSAAPTISLPRPPQLGLSAPLAPTLLSFLQQTPRPAGPTEPPPDRQQLASLTRPDYSQYPTSDRGYPDFSRLYPQIEQKYGLPPGTMRGLVEVESQGNPDAVGPPVRMADGSVQNARGIVQFMPGTARQFGVDPTDAPRALDAGGRYLGALIRKHGGNVQAALQEYGGARGDPTFAYSRKVTEAMGNQNLVSPQPRGPDQWGRRDPSWMIGGPPGLMPTQRDVPSLMGFAGLLLPIAALASGMPLGIALEAYGAMARARQNGDQLDFKMRSQEWELAMKQHQDMEALEGQAVGDAFIEFDKDKNPDGLQRELMDIAGRFQDRHLMQMAQNKQFDAAFRINERRDQLNQPLAKWQQAQEQHKEIAAEVAARDRDYREQFVRDNGREPTDDEMRHAHFANLAAATQELKAKPSRPESETQRKAADDRKALDAALADDAAQWKKKWGENGPDDQGRSFAQAYEDMRKAREARTPAAAARPLTRAQGEEAAIEEATKAANEEWDKSHPDATARERADAHLDNRRKAEERLPSRPGATPSAAAMVEQQAERIAQARTEEWAAKQTPPPAPESNAWKDHYGDELVKARQQLNARASGSQDLAREKWETALQAARDSDEKWRNDFVAKNKREPTDLEQRLAHDRNLQEALQAQSSRASGITGRAAQMTGRQTSAAYEVEFRLKALADLPMGARSGGLLGGYDPGKSAVGALKSDLTRVITPTEDQAMQAIAQGLGRELAALQMPVYLTQTIATSLEKNLPKAGENIGVALIKLADLRQTATAGLESMLHYPASVITDEQKAEMAAIQQAITRAIPWTLDQAVAFGLGPNRKMSFGQFMTQHPPRGTQQEGAPLSDKDRQAIEWAKAHPTDPRAARILQLHPGQ